ncbi:hypothetical protein Esti_003828 [Eimeria stiedai]
MGEGGPRGMRRPRGPSSPHDGRSPKRRNTSQGPPAFEDEGAPSLAQGAPLVRGEGPPTSGPPGAATREDEGPPKPFSQLQHAQLSCGLYLLPLLQHVLRQRLRAALRGHLHTVTWPPPPSGGPPSAKQKTFEPSSAVESLLRGESAAAAALRVRGNSTGSSSSSSDKRASVEAVAGALAAKLVCCLQLKEKSSILILGPRGSGATTAVETALRFVQRQQQQQQPQQQQQQQLVVVRVNCSLYPNDAAILQAIVRRLCAALQQQQQQQRQQQQVSACGEGTFGDSLKRLRDLLVDCCSVLGRPVVVVLDRVEVCCLVGGSSSAGGPLARPPQQHLLYSLFDLQQTPGLHICSICLSPVLDLTDSMEKRIRSRFTMQRLCLSGCVSRQQLLSFIQHKLLAVSLQQLLACVSSRDRNRLLLAEKGGGATLLPADATLAKAFLKAFEATVEQELNQPHFRMLCERALSLGRDPRSFLVAAVSPVLLLRVPLPPSRAGAGGFLCGWGAHEVPEALSPLHSPLRQKETHVQHSTPTLMRQAGDSKHQQQQQQQQGGGKSLLSFCQDAVKPLQAAECLFEQFRCLSFSEHLILTSMARLHRKRMLPKTLLTVLVESSAFFKLHNPMRRQVSQAGLRRAFAQLLESGLLQRCVYGLQHLGFSGVALDLQGSHQPYKFPHHQIYADLAVSFPSTPELSVHLNARLSSMQARVHAANKSFSYPLEAGGTHRSREGGGPSLQQQFF